MRVWKGLSQNGHRPRRGPLGFVARPSLPRKSVVLWLAGPTNHSANSPRIQNLTQPNPPKTETILPGVIVFLEFQSQTNVFDACANGKQLLTPGGRPPAVEASPWSSPGPGIPMDPRSQAAGSCIHPRLIPGWAGAAPKGCYPVHESGHPKMPQPGGVEPHSPCNCAELTAQLGVGGWVK